MDDSQSNPEPRYRSAKDSTELARLCTLDIGKEVTSDDVRGYLLAGDKALERFDPEDRREIAMTLIKEMANG